MSNWVEQPHVRSCYCTNVDLIAKKAVEIKVDSIQEMNKAADNLQWNVQNISDLIREVWTMFYEQMWFMYMLMHSR